ncbi:MAG: mannose-6-phosphate isomerase, partial [Kineosporiaceae bacterium]
MRPVLMPPNRLVHFYRGGAGITRLRRVPAPAERSPEEWLASVTTRHGEVRTGLSALPDGTLLRDAVAADPAAWVGPHPLPGGPGDTGVLVKLLDAGQRLPVHLHPTREFARHHLGSCYGKTEAWYVLGTSGERPQVHLGWRAEVSAADLARAVAEQDAAWMLDRMHALDVRPGDAVHVPAGAVHAVGAGILLVEVQEPTDLSLLVEHAGFAAPEDAFLGLAAADALAAVDRGAWGPERLAGLHRHVDLQARAADPVRLLPPEADDFFRADLVAPAPGTAVAVAAGFSVLVTVHGAGRLAWDGGDAGTSAVTAGDVLAVPHAAGPWSLAGDVAAVLCRPAPPGA